MPNDRIRPDGARSDWFFREDDDADFGFIARAAAEQDEWAALGPITAYGLATLGIALIVWLLH